jgi:hypothetical protein
MAHNAYSTSPVPDIATDSTGCTAQDELLRPNLRHAYPLPETDERFRVLLDALAQSRSSGRHSEPRKGCAGSEV